MLVISYETCRCFFLHSLKHLSSLFIRLTQFEHLFLLVFLSVLFILFLFSLIFFLKKGEIVLIIFTTTVFTPYYHHWAHINLCTSLTYNLALVPILGWRCQISLLTKKLVALVCNIFNYNWFSSSIFYSKWSKRWINCFKYCKSRCRVHCAFHHVLNVITVILRSKQP